MRWSGRDRLALDVPGAVEHLHRLGHAEGAGGERLAQLGRLHDRRRVGHQDPAGRAGPARRASPPATARAGRARPGRARSRRCPRSSRAPRPGSAPSASAPRNDADVGLGPVGEVLPQLVAGRSSAPARSRVIDSAPEPTPDSSTRAPGKMSASMQDRARGPWDRSPGRPRGIFSTKSASVGRSTRYGHALRSSGR